MEIRFIDDDDFVGFFPHDVAKCPSLLQIVVDVELAGEQELVEEAYKLLRLCSN